MKPICQNMIKNTVQRSRVKLILKKNIKYFQGLGIEIRLTGSMKKNDSDEDLAACAASGEAAAFRELLNRHYDRVFRVVYSVLRNTSDAEDVTQEIWAALPAKLL